MASEGAKGMALDPVSIGLIGASALGGLFGGDDENRQAREGSFKGTSVDPIMTLRDALDSIKRMGMGIGEMPPVKTGVQLRRPGPVNIPGIPFQIGGALGADPGMGDPAYVNPYALAEQIFRPMGGQNRTPGQQSEDRSLKGFGHLFDSIQTKHPKVVAQSQDQSGRLF